MEHAYVIDLKWPSAMPAGAVEDVEVIARSQGGAEGVAVLQCRADAPAFLRVRVVIQAPPSDASWAVANILVGIEDALPSAHIARCAKEG